MKKPELGLLTFSGAASLVSVALLVDAGLKEKEASNKLESLSRSELITALTLDDKLILKEENQMSIFKKVTKWSYLMMGSGVALMAGAAIKSQTIDKSCDCPCFDVCEAANEVAEAAAEAAKA